MRGAGLRLDNDVRRVWSCAACGAERKVGAQVTTVNCQCSGSPSMKLIEGMRRDRPLKELTTTYMEFEFEPGELAPPRPRKEEVPPTLNSDTKLDFEMPAVRTSAAEGGDVAPPADDAASLPASEQRPPRPHDRRSDRGPNSPRGLQGRQENRPDNRLRREEAGPREHQPRRDQPPRREPGPPAGSQRESATDENAASTNTPPGASSGRRRNRNRRGNRSGSPPPPGDNSSFGEGIPDQPPAPTQE